MLQLGKVNFGSLYSKSGSLSRVYDRLFPQTTEMRTFLREGQLEKIVAKVKKESQEEKLYFLGIKSLRKTITTESNEIWQKTTRIEKALALASPLYAGMAATCAYTAFTAPLGATTLAAGALAVSFASLCYIGLQTTEYLGQVYRFTSTFEKLVEKHTPSLA